jgi:hypothetical protein
MNFCSFTSEGWQTFPVKNWMVNALGFAGQTVAIATTQLCHCGVRAAADNLYTDGYGQIPIKLYLHKQAECGIWPVISSLPAPDL